MRKPQQVFNSVRRRLEDFNNAAPRLAGLKSKEKQRITNASVLSPFGAGTPTDMDANLIPGYNLPNNASAMRQQVETLYYTDWAAQKIIDIPVDDMLREPFKFECGDIQDIDTRITDYCDTLNLNKALRQALRLERLYGGSGIFMGVKDNSDNPSQPIDYAAISPGDLQFLNVVSRYQISKLEWQTDPTKPGYGRPYTYFIQGERVHHSRLLIFDGDPISPSYDSLITSQANIISDGFGYPMLMRIAKDLMRATLARQAATHLIQRASVMVFSGDIQTGLAFKSGESNLESLKSLLNSISNYQAALINSTPGSTASLETLAANFGAIPELLLSQLQVLSASCDVPATRFLGQAPGGLNATGLSDLENYYNMIRARQHNHLSPQLHKLLKVLLPSAGITNVLPLEVDIIFKALWNATELEQAQTRNTDVNSINTLVMSGLVSNEEALEELKQRGVLLTDPVNFPAPTLPERNTAGLDTLFTDSLTSLKGVGDVDTAQQRP